MNHGIQNDAYQDDNLVIKNSHLESQVCNESKLDLQNTIQNDTDDYKKRINGIMQLVKDNQQIFEKIRENYLEKIEELSIYIEVLENSSYNGKMLWRINNFTNRRKETPIVHSAPVYTDQYGYKLCMRMYLNGDGDGKGTHLSLFIVMMKGLNDDLLKWPLKNKTIDLCIATEKKNVCKRKIYTNASRIFQKPTRQMNPAYGFQEFITLKKAETLLINDSLYIKCKINM